MTASSTMMRSVKSASMVMFGLANFALAAILAAVLSDMGWWRTMGLRAPARWTALLWFVPTLLPMAINFIPGLEIVNVQHVAFVLVAMLLLSLVEEGYFRGLMLTALNPHCVWKAVIVTSVLFGLTHSMNVLSGKSLRDDIAQIIYAFAIGFGFAALAMRRGLIWPLVLVHFGIVFVNKLQVSGHEYSAGATIAITVTRHWPPRSLGLSPTSTPALTSWRAK
jgi:membrane protease YdiL (CAAX protease family)